MFTNLLLFTNLLQPFDVSEDHFILLYSIIFSQAIKNLGAYVPPPLHYNDPVAELEGAQQVRALLKCWSITFFVSYSVSECLKVPRNPSNLAFICTQIGLIHEIF